jgi:choline kinase
MIAVILAAGAGTRLRPHTDLTPKCLLDIGGMTLLGRTLETLRSRKIEDIVCVTGYRREQIARFVGGEFPRMNVEFVANDLYATTNNIYSLWLAHKLIEGRSLLLLDSDILFDARILDLLLDSPDEDCLAVRSGGGLGSEEIKVSVDGEGGVVMIGKEIDPSAAMGESIGIEKFGPTFVGELIEELNMLVRKEGQVEIFYEAAFQRVIDRGRRPRAVPTGSLPCIEIDTPADLQAARALVQILNPVEHPRSGKTSPR